MVCPKGCSVGVFATNDDPMLIGENYAPMFPRVDRLFDTL
jgi:hypothetical protein